MDEVLALMIPVNYNPNMALKHDMNKNINRTMILDLKGRKICYVNGIEKE